MSERGGTRRSTRRRETDLRPASASSRTTRRRTTGTTTSSRTRRSGSRSTTSGDSRRRRTSTRGFTTRGTGLRDREPELSGRGPGRARAQAGRFRLLPRLHLYVAPRSCASAPDATLAHFVHIPWPQPDYWRVLPDAIRRALHEGHPRERRRQLPHASLAAELPSQLRGHSSARRWTIVARPRAGVPDVAGATRRSRLTFGSSRSRRGAMRCSQPKPRSSPSVRSSLVVRV